MSSAHQHRVGDSQRVGRDRERRIDPPTGRKKRGVDHIEIIDAMGPIVGIQNTGCRVCAKSARATDMGQALVVFGLREKHGAEGLEQAVQARSHLLDPVPVLGMDCVMKIKPSGSGIHLDAVFAVGQVLHDRRHDRAP